MQRVQGCEVKRCRGSRCAGGTGSQIGNLKFEAYFEVL